MQGSLLLAFGMFSSYRRHFCVLNQNEFQFTQQCSNPRTGSVSIKNAQIIVPIDSTDKFQIKSQGLTIQAKADNAQSRIKWVKVLTPSKKQIKPFSHSVVDQIYSIRDEVNNVIGQIMKKINQQQAQRLRILLDTLSKKINQLISISRKSKSNNNMQQNDSDLSFHSVLDSKQLQLHFIDNDGDKQQIIANPLQETKLKTYDNIKDRILKENPVFMKVFNSFTREANRIQLPIQSQQKNIDLINILKGVIGMDNLILRLPVSAYEPISCLQKIAQEMMYQQLLLEAHKSQDPAKRMLYVISFALSAYSLSRPRLQYRSVLGQTYEMKTQRYKFISEQVGFNQSAFHCQSDQYTIEGLIQTTTQFTGRSLQIIPQGYTHIYLKKYKQTISYNRTQKSIKNLVFGQATAVNQGQIKFNNYQGQEGFLVLKSRSIIFNDTNPNAVQGWVKSHGVLRYLIDGSWSGHLTVDDIKLKSKDKIWQGQDEIFPQYYNFSDLTIFLNHLNLNEISNIPATDTRFRPDIKAHQYGMMQQCQRQRDRIQNKQKQRSRVYTPIWFEPSIHEFTNTTFYKFNNKYWKFRIQKKWPSILDIY